MKYLSIPFLCFSLCFMFSCKPSVNSEQVVKIDAQIDEVEKTLEEFRAVDTASLLRNYRNLIDNVRYIQKNYTDTISLKTAQFLSRYYRMRKLIEDYGDYASIEEEIEISIEQLEDLKYDYVNNVLSETKFNDYFTIEINNYFKLQERVQNMINNSEEFNKKFTEYNPKVDSIVKRIQSKKSNLRL